ncbi:Microtubule-associated protein RP/EB family member 1 [Gossypium australe]|uniref:Microtubule-associated protein RP/EB family member 1 n=1 Tax=Gossypium australe TaxID=47621 RepID=A0A5B6V2W3_9ROSI|nr:Microtubule-associated protein RP/EB family member 1 [Gossypium australe]
MAEKPPPKPILPQDWESLVEDFQYGGFRREKWRSLSPSVVELALSSIQKKEFPFKIPLVIFLEEFSDLLFPQDPSLASLMDRLVETLRAVVQSPTDGVHVTYALKEQMMVSTTSILISTNAVESVEVQFTESVVELLLAVINRPNHGPDRHARATACECLRELEKAYPCLLSDIAGHLWSLCQGERTHASQSYILLFTTVIHSIVNRKLSVSILNTSVPLIPFNVPQCVVELEKEGLLELNYKELRRAMAFLLEWPQVLTPCGMMIFMGMIMPLAVALDLQPSMLKVQFFGMIYSFNPLLYHVVLVMYSHFSEAFNEQEIEIVRRLYLVSLETQQHLVFRLLSVHWLMVFLNRLMVEKKKSIVETGFMFYPSVFDPLSLKALKLDLLAFCSVCIDKLNPQSVSDMEGNSVVKLFQDGLVSVLGFKWLPPWSTETAVAFRTFHKVLIGASSHSETDPSTTTALMESAIFNHLKGMFVDLILEFQRLVPVIVAFIDRLLGCQKHLWLGERLLQTIDANLHSRVAIDYRLVSYFPIFDRIAENQTIPPRRLLELLTKFMAFVVEKHGPDTGVKSWSWGTKVLGICRTMLTHHQSSRLFLGLSRLLAFTCLYFPDLEVRDHARIYLRMLICVPGVKLRGMLNLGEQLLGISPSSHSGSFFNVPSPRHSQDPKKLKNIASYIHLERMIPLLVKQAWSLSLFPLRVGSNKPEFSGGFRDGEASTDERELDANIQFETVLDGQVTDKPQAPLYVMDSKVSEILAILRRHFSYIPDFRHMPGLRVKIPCYLRFDTESFNNVWGGESPKSGLHGVDALPAIYATVLKFSSLAPYGSIPTCHIPFLLGQPPTSGDFCGENVSLDIIATHNGDGGSEEDIYKASAMIELEPREPTPGMVDVFIETNGEDGQIITGQLQSITVGIEDLFLKAIAPPDIPEDVLPDYYSDLFNALWDACGTTSNTGREIFPLKSGKGFAAIHGTRSVKLLEIPPYALIRATEHYLAPFVVSVSGDRLIDMVKDNGIIRDVVWQDEASGLLLEAPTSVAEPDSMPLCLTLVENEEEQESQLNIGKRSLGCIHVLIFLPPMFHLLLQMEVSDASTLVRIRTDHWPCLAYIDDYLEALFLS